MMILSSVKVLKLIAAVVTYFWSRMVPLRENNLSIFFFPELISDVELNVKYMLLTGAT